MIEPSTPAAASESDPAAEAEPTGSPLAPPLEHVPLAIREPTPAPPTLPPPEPYPVPARAAVGDANPRPDDADGGWPRSAKVTTAVLALLTLVGGAAAGWFAWHADDDDANADELETELDQRAAEAADLRDERDAALAEVDEAIGDRDELAAQLAELGLRIDELDDRVAALEIVVERLGNASTPTSEPSTSSDESEISPPVPSTPADETSADETSADETSADETPADETSADETPADETPADEIPADALIGNYTIEFTEEYCEGPVSCGSPPEPAAASIVESNEGWLELVVPDMLTVALFDIDGGLSGVGDSTTIVEPCNGDDRAARVLVTLWLDDAATADGGDVEGLRASVSVNALPSDDCPYALAFFASTLVPS